MEAVMMASPVIRAATPHEIVLECITPPPSCLNLSSCMSQFPSIGTELENKDKYT